MEPAQRPIQSVLGLFPGRKAAGPELNHLPSCIAQVKNEWSHTSAPPVCFRGVHVDFTFTFTMCVLYFSLHHLVEIFFAPINI